MTNRYPTSEELYALEREARRMRAEHMSGLLRKLSKAIANSWQRLSNGKGVKGLRHA